MIATVILKNIVQYKIILNQFFYIYILYSYVNLFKRF